MRIIKNKRLRKWTARVARIFIHRFMRSPVKAAHREYSMVYSQHDNPGKPTPELIDLALAAIHEAMRINLSLLGERSRQAYPDVNEFPGEHYRLLAGLVRILRPMVVIEIGTERGLSCLAIKSELQTNAKIYTFDIKAWHTMPNPILREADFDFCLEQHVDDLTKADVQKVYQPIFESCDLIFMDAAKDGSMESTFLAYFSTIQFKKKPILIVDDIHNWNMLAVWRAIEKPKLDITSFGHFTGTGLVQL